MADTTKQNVKQAANAAVRKPRNIAGQNKGGVKK